MARKFKNFSKKVKKSTTMNKIIVLIALLSIFNILNAQRENPLIRQGNRSFDNKKYSDAESKYNRAKKINEKSLIATYNLANAQYKQNNFAGAIENLQTIEAKTKNSDTLFNILYNAGNYYVKQAEDSLKQQNLDGTINKLETALKYYKSAIKRNPKDYQAKYNYLLTEQLLKQLKQQQQQQKQQNQQQQQNNQDQNKNKEQEKQDEENKQKEKQNQKQEQQASQIPYEEMQKILNAIQNADQKTQQKVKLNLQKNVKTNDKNW